MQHAMRAIKFELFWIREEESVPKALSSHKEHPVGSSSPFYTSKAPSSLVFTDVNCGNMTECESEREILSYMSRRPAVWYLSVLWKKGKFLGDLASDLKRPP